MAVSKSSFKFKYRSIAVGGTFDHIHKGHRALLARAFELGERVYIGVSSDEFAKQRGKTIQHDFDTRKNQIVRFVKTNYPGRDFTITKLDSAFGPGMFTRDIEAITVSEETASSVISANLKRRVNGLPDLQVEVVNMITAENGKRISSTRIRAGEIDTEGRVIRK